MNKKIITPIIIIVLIAIAVIFLSRVSRQDMSLTPKEGDIVIVINEQNNSGEKGGALISKDGEKTKIIVKIFDAPRDSQPAKINFGSCFTPAELIGANPPVMLKYDLSDLKNGVSETILDASFATFNSIPLSLVIYKSSEKNEIVSCGNIVANGKPAFEILPPPMPLKNTATGTSSFKIPPPTIPPPPLSPKPTSNTSSGKK